MIELKHAIRSLFRSPGFTLIAIVTIALGIGANVTLFSVFERLILSPIDLPDAGRLVRIWTNNPKQNITGPVMSVPKYQMFAGQQTVFSGIAASSFNTVVITHDGVDPQQLTGLSVTASFLPTLGLSLVRGRNFTADEDKRYGPHVCLISYDLWATHFGKSGAILGKAIELDGVPTQIVGVLADRLPAPISTVQVIEPWPLSPAFLTEQQLQAGAGFLQVTARLKPGVTFATADAEVRTIAKRYADQFPARLDGVVENELRTWIEEQVGPVRPTLVMLLSAVGLVLLIACANVSNLFLGRLFAREKEIAIRVSLGATRRRVTRQFLLESMIFCVLAGAAGLGLALIALRGAERLFVTQLQTPTTFALDARMLAVTLGLSVISSLAIGLVPALQASRVDLSRILKETTRGASGGARATRFRSAMIVAEVSLTVVLLVESSLLLISFVKLQSADAGFTTAGIASVYVSPPVTRYPTKTEKDNFYYAILDKLHAYPQVKLAAVTQGLPLTNNSPRGVYMVFGRPEAPLGQRPIAFLDVVSEEYFSMLHVPLLRGRPFGAADIDGAPLVCVINASFAKSLFPNEDPMGKYLLLGQQGQTKMEIVGVVGDVKAAGLNAPPPETIYSPLRQFGGGPGQSIVAYTTGDPAALESVLRSAVQAVDPGQAVSSFATLESQVAQSLGVQRLTAWLTGAFAFAALFLSALGLYGVLAYAVTQRAGEISIRLALGAERTDVVGLVVKQGMGLVAIGLALGLVIAAAAGRLVATLLYGVVPMDFGVFAGVSAVFVLVAAAACLIPAWRASRYDALAAMRAG